VSGETWTSATHRDRNRGLDELAMLRAVAQPCGDKCRIWNPRFSFLSCATHAPKSGWEYRAMSHRRIVFSGRLRRRRNIFRTAGAESDFQLSLGNDKSRRRLLPPPPGYRGAAEEGKQSAHASIHVRGISARRDKVIASSTARLSHSRQEFSLPLAARGEEREGREESSRSERDDTRWRGTKVRGRKHAGREPRERRGGGTES